MVRHTDTKHADSKRSFTALLITVFVRTYLNKDRVSVCTKRTARNSFASGTCSPVEPGETFDSRLCIDIVLSLLGYSFAAFGVSSLARVCRSVLLSGRVGCGRSPGCHVNMDLLKMLKTEYPVRQFTP
ncbi:hypothetical protein RB195_010607 [Necator americanus]|uniref:Uncharacterized protein n=1 Tax=Necator americanus TaxID=51031 RepID=A0ABR1CYN3_NECAM